MHNFNNPAVQSQLLVILEQIAYDANSKIPGYKDRKVCAGLARNALQLLGAERKDAIVEDESNAVAAPAKISGPAGHFTVYTDGACKGNPGPAAWGVVIIQNGQIELKEGDFIGDATNQVAELAAAINGLSKVPFGSTVELVSDSQYVLKGLSEWRSGWERRGWRNSQGEAVANQEYWMKLFALADERKVTTRWVRGHNGDPMNELCDKLANRSIAARGLVT